MCRQVLHWGCTHSCSESPPPPSWSPRAHPALIIASQKYSKGTETYCWQKWGVSKHSHSHTMLCKLFCLLNQSLLQISIIRSTIAMPYHPPQTSLWQAVIGHSLRPHCGGNFLYWMRTPWPEEEIEVGTSNQSASNHLFHAKLSAPLQCFCQFVEAALVPLNCFLPTNPAMRHLLLRCKQNV